MNSYSVLLALRKYGQNVTISACPIFADGPEDAGAKAIGMFDRNFYDELKVVLVRVTTSTFPQERARNK